MLQLPVDVPVFQEPPGATDSDRGPAGAPGPDEAPYCTAGPVQAVGAMIPATQAFLPSRVPR